MMRSHYFLMALFIFSLYWLYLLYSPYLMNILIASLLAISTANVHLKLISLTHSTLFSSTLISLALALLFLLPLGYFLTTLTLHLNTIDVNQLKAFIGTFDSWLGRMPDSLTFMIPTIKEQVNDENINVMLKETLTLATSLGKYSATFLKNAIMIVVFYFFVNFYGKSLMDFLRKVLQLRQQDATLLGFELMNVMSVVFYSIIVTALFEGALFGVMITFFGYNGLLFGILYGFASLIPIIGGALLWVPFALYFLAHDQSFNALFIAIYSIIIISVIADTFIKPMIIRYINLRIVKAETKINELLIFFAILAGLTTFGFWGMIIGPGITAFFLAMTKLINQPKPI